MTRKAERLAGGRPARRLEGRKDQNNDCPTPNTHHQKIQLFEIFDPETLGAVIVLAREVSV